ncbi:hypothetical protein AVEN_69500-1 [Araneus ventricosus]|uniref:Uncharacterized protein n=1 Tax=Araneus ventricosus TaxID=182803 RepID=A0A4Y2ILB4_ARAVE|nr:hypothetical protein AVEN_69500-1 [Araneus ventricosus]
MHSSMTFNRCLQLSVHSLHNSIGSRMKSRGYSLAGAQELGQILKNIALKISASVRCYYFRNAKTCNPTVVESPCNCVRQLVTHRKGFRPPAKSVNKS